jgi:hypothetical protein
MTKTNKIEAIKYSPYTVFSGNMDKKEGWQNIKNVSNNGRN